MKYRVLSFILILLALALCTSTLFAAERIEKWKTKDGKEFSTKIECEEYEFFIKNKLEEIKKEITKPEESIFLLSSSPIYDQEKVITSILKILLKKRKTLKIVDIE